VTEAQLIAAVSEGDYEKVLAIIKVCCPPTSAKLTTDGLLDYLEGSQNEDPFLASVRSVNTSLHLLAVWLSLAKYSGLTNLHLPLAREVRIAWLRLYLLVR